MNTDIENMIKSCEVCNCTSRVPKEKVDSKWPEAKQTFERVHIDLFHFRNENYLIFVDAYSKFIDVKLLRKADANSVINKLEELFSYFGLPAVIISDNGPPFNSYQFLKFASEKNIKVLKSPVYHAQSNGLAERGVQTVKQYFKKFVLDNKLTKESGFQKIQRFRCGYNNTPSTVTGKSPNEIILNYVPRTEVNMLNPLVNQEKRKLVSKKENSKVTLNKSMAFKKEFSGGEEILYRNHFRSYFKWIPGRVIKRLSKYIYVIEVKGNRKTVHYNQIKASPVKEVWYSDPRKVQGLITSRKRKSRSVSSPPAELRRSKRARTVPRRFPM